MLCCKNIWNWKWKVSQLALKRVINAVVCSIVSIGESPDPGSLHAKIFMVVQLGQTFLCSKIQWYSEQVGKQVREKGILPWFLSLFMLVQKWRNLLLLISITIMRAALVFNVGVQQNAADPPPSVTISQWWEGVADGRIMFVVEGRSFHCTVLCSY